MENNLLVEIRNHLVAEFRNLFLRDTRSKWSSLGLCFLDLNGFLAKLFQLTAIVIIIFGDYPHLRRYHPKALMIRIAVLMSMSLFAMMGYYTLASILFKLYLLYWMMVVTFLRAVLFTMEVVVEVGLRFIYRFHLNERHELLRYVDW